VIGVVGGYGDVGAPACRRLAAAGFRVRIGGRNGAAARELADALGADHRRVDWTDPSTVEDFAAGCEVLLNCSGPSYLIGDRLARAAIRVGADYVDAAGDDSLHGVLDHTQLAASGRTAVLSAGLRPGLTGIVPHALTVGFETAELTVSFGLRDRFTATAAADYLHVLREGATRPLAAWRDGPCDGVLTRYTAADLPFFPGEATVTPLLSPEDERVARTLGLRRGEWYSVVGGAHVREAFDRVHALGTEAAVEMLCRASRLDLSGRAPAVTIVVRTQGSLAGVPACETTVVSGAGNAEVTGAVAAYTVLAVVRAEVPPGLHYAADALDPVRALEWLQADGVIRAQHLDALSDEIEDGAL
jgi:NAD(P)-dependent dehydrogenase (short-subunit alcohol dehydrogenase family)